MGNCMAQKDKTITVTNKENLTISKQDFIQINQGKFRDFY